MQIRWYAPSIWWIVIENEIDFTKCGAYLIYQYTRLVLEHQAPMGSCIQQIIQHHHRGLQLPLGYGIDSMPNQTSIDPFLRVFGNAKWLIEIFFYPTKNSVKDLHIICHRITEDRFRNLVWLCCDAADQREQKCQTNNCHFIGTKASFQFILLCWLNQIDFWSNLRIRLLYIQNVDFLGSLARFLWQNFDKIEDCYKCPRANNRYRRDIYLLLFIIVVVRVWLYLST